MPASASPPSTHPTAATLLQRRRAAHPVPCVRVCGLRGDVAGVETQHGRSGGEVLPGGAVGCLDWRKAELGAEGLDHALRWGVWCAWWISSLSVGKREAQKHDWAALPPREQTHHALNMIFQPIIMESHHLVFVRNQLPPSPKPTGGACSDVTAKGHTCATTKGRPSLSHTATESAGGGR